MSQPIRRVYPRLGDPVTLTRDVRATFIHGRTCQAEHGHVLMAGWQVRPEIRDDLPDGQTVIVQYTYGGTMSRYEIPRSALEIQS